MSEIREPKYWGEEDDERLTHQTKDEAIEAILDAVDELPEAITIVGFAPMVVDWQFITPLADLIERLDDDGYGGEDGSEITKAMEEAEAAFMAVVKSEYVSYSCEEVTREEVNVGEWIKAHRPDWLEAKS
jgi:hypothetical protein